MDIPNITPEGFGASLLTALLTFFGGKRLFSVEKVKSAVDETSVVAAVAQATVIENLQNELERISASFGRVLKELEQSHNDNLKLREANLELLDKVSQLHNTINQMKEQLNAFERRRKQCGDCEIGKQNIAIDVVQGS